MGPHRFRKLDPDPIPHQSKKRDPDPHQRDADPHLYSVCKGVINYSFYHSVVLFLPWATQHIQ
jgi:hypothetical protein